MPTICSALCRFFMPNPFRPFGPAGFSHISWINFPGGSHDGMAVTRRPMRSVHHTASKQSIIGGGSGVPKPGEITLAHFGILFLDEIAEFSSSTLDALRQPIETGEISVSRVGGTLTFPSRFTLVAAMNPCPCGYFGTDGWHCMSHEGRR